MVSPPFFFWSFLGGKGMRTVGGCLGGGED